jgi:tRNA pseudouridine32 synthase / 23S rRNA pseudouridine746 synthase
MIVHVDPAFVIAEKPSGLPTVPGRPVELHDCLWHRVRERHADALVVHRLDMGTSGLVVFARGIEAQRVLSRAFEQRVVGKTYMALAAGELAEDHGEIDLPLAADWLARPRQLVDREHGKSALTRWRVLERHGTHTRVELQPRTGRSHQLRVHLAAIGHPLLGDPLYAPPAIEAAMPRLALHACGLAFMHPFERTPHVYTSAVPF